MHTNTAIHGDLGMVGEKDLVILLSKSGNTKETLELVDHLKKKKCAIWGITFQNESRLRKKIEKNLVMKLKDEGDKWNISPINSSTIYLILLQGIAVELSKRLNVTLEKFGSNHPGGDIGSILGNQSCG
jgi:arabinose-5-phosphate isomerase